jgi:hypothetical protein
MSVRRTKQGIPSNNRRHIALPKPGATHKGHWEMVWYPALAGSTSLILMTEIVHLTSLWHMALGGTVMLIGVTFLLGRRMGRGERNVRWILTPKHAAEEKPTLIVVFERCAMVHIGKQSYRVNQPPHLERDEFGQPHLASLEAEMICFTDNLPRGYITLIRDEKTNAEYIVQIQRSENASIRDTFTLNR